MADAHRREWAFVLAATVRLTRDLDVAEECVQEAYARALTAWADGQVPNRPGAWLTTVARHLALDGLRRDATMRRALPLLVADETEPETVAGEEFPDDRLRLICTCCHPALDQEVQIALTLRLVCGLTTAEVARSFLVKETTMAARITRAKKKIAAARIPYRVPSTDELPERIDAVLSVVHLVFTAGHTAPAGDRLVRHDLVDRAVDLARMLHALLPDDGEVAGLLGLLLLTDARRRTRVAADGRMLLLAEQDRAQWDRAAIEEGIDVVRQALSRETSCRRPVGRFALQAAIAAVHAEAPTYADTDWGEIVALYDLLARRWPSPVVALNRAVAVGMARGPGAGLELLDELSAEPQLAGYGYLPSARAHFLRQLGRIDDARAAYQEAILLTENAVERDFLADRLDQLGR